jgi:hypothetical protein
VSENKFIQHLKGKATAGSVVEIKNQATPASFANMPSGTSNANNVYADVRGNATVVAQGTTNWKLNGANLVLVSNVSGDGNDYTGVYGASGAGLWINATYTFPSTGDPNHPVAMIFNPNTKWVLKLCGDNLLANGANTIDFSLVITIGSSNIITKNFTIAEQANKFCKEFVIDFAESNQALIKAQGTTTMQVQLLCATASATARIYNGMTVFTALQRRVDGGTVATDQKTFPDVIQDIDDINDEIDQIHEDIDDLEDYVDDTFVRLDGESIMTGPLKMRATSSFQCAIAPFWDGVGFYKLNSDDSVTLIASIETPDGFLPWTTNTYNIGSSLKKWKNLYLAGKAYVPVINNGYDIAVPVTNSADTLALKSEVDLAANSGRMITDQGLWYAKMYSATVAPSAEDGTNYADFSQTDGQGNPIIVTYNRVNGAWVQGQTITPPAEYDGYVPITSKIWDIAEQAGQQGGRILWNHQSKDFTPYPQIISFENAALSGVSTAPTPTNGSPNNQIVNKEYVDNAIGNGTITLTQGGTPMGSFTTNQSNDMTIALDGGSSYHPDLFDWKWADHQLNDAQWLRADTFSWQSGAVYQAAYNELYDDIVDCVCWANLGEPGVYTKQRKPEVGDPVFNDYDLTQQVGVVSAYANDSIVCNEVTYPFLDIYTVNGGSTETIAGISVLVRRGRSGRKCVLIRSSTKDPTAESDVAAIYNATGVAWYYIVDAENERFKLPRTKYGVTGLRDTVGNYVEPGLPNITGTFTNNVVCVGGRTATGAFRSRDSGGSYGANTATSEYGKGFNFDASLSDPIYGASTTVQSPATQMYLYFYMGQFTQTALENTAGINTELFNEKADTDLSNVNNTGKTAVVGWVMPDWQNAQNIDISIKNNPYTITENGYYVMVLNKNTANADAKILVNGIMVAVVAISASWESTRVTLPLCVGDVVSSSGSVYSASISHYVPIKGLSA